MASTAFITYERLRFQEDVTRQLTTVADVIGAGAGPALAAHDLAAGENALHALFAEPHIIAACLISRMAEHWFAAANQAYAPITETCSSRDPSFRKGTSSASSGCVSNGRVSFDALRHDMAMVSLAMAVCFIIAVLLSSRLQRTISGPVLRLAATAREVAIGRNYGLREEKIRPG